MKELFKHNTSVTQYYSNSSGSMVLGDSVQILQEMNNDSIDLVVTSPPFSLTRKKDYGNYQGDEYLDWFKPFASNIHRILKPEGSFVLDLGGAWNPGEPTRSLYQFKLLIMLCEEFGFNLAQDFYWWNPARLPAPAEWVTVRRIRVKDAINTVWWLSKTAYPKASNQRVLQPYSGSQEKLMKEGYTAKLRPSGHEISKNFVTNNGGSIPPNLLALSNTESNSAYLRYCRENNITAHPARFPQELPEYFIRMLTDPGDIVLDPFAGSCTTGAAAQALDRKWLCCEQREEYLQGAKSRFLQEPKVSQASGGTYSAYRPSLQQSVFEEPLSGGQKRKKKVDKKNIEGKTGA